MGNQASYAYLSRKGLLDTACAHMTISPKYSYKRWSKREVFDEAGKYKTRAEFRRMNQGAYGYAQANGLLDQVCIHMISDNFWHLFELMAVALKYQNLSEFKKSERRAYNYAVRAKLIGFATAHMTRHVTQWTKELVMQEASKHTVRGVFQAAASGAYKHADKHGYLDEACAHMQCPEYGFSPEKQATLYHLRLTFKSGQTLYKLGITNRDVAKRIIGMGLPRSAVVSILDQIKFDCGRDARIAEKRLHRRYAGQKYHGSHVMKNGNTELFHVPLIDQPN